MCNDDFRKNGHDAFNQCTPIPKCLLGQVRSICQACWEDMPQQPALIEFSGKATLNICKRMPEAMPIFIKAASLVALQTTLQTSCHTSVLHA